MKPFDPSDIFRHRTLQGLDGSCRHQRTAFIVTRALRKSDRYRSVAWLYPHGDPAGPQRLTSPGFDAHSPVLSPDGNVLAFLSSRAGKHRQLHLLRLDGGEAHALTDEHERTPQSILGWSPDGSRLLLRALVRWPQGRGFHGAVGDGPASRNGLPVVADFLPYKLDGSGYTIGGRSHLFSVDAARGGMTALVEGDVDVGEACWSPDGGSLACVRKRGGRQRHRSDLWIADADGGNARQVTTDIASVLGVRWSPDSRRIAFAGNRREGDSLMRLWLLDLDRGSIDCLGDESGGDDELELASGGSVWHPDGDRLAVVAAHRGLQQIAVVAIPQGRITRLRAGLSHVVGLAPCGDRLAFVAASMRKPDELYSMGWDGAERQRHSGFNRDWFAQRMRPHVSKRCWRVPDGDGGEEQVEAWLLLPAGHSQGPFPLLVDMHGGPQSMALVDFAAHVYWYLLCSRGWAVLAPDAVGSGSYGARFARRLRGRWGELDLPQYLAIIEDLQSRGIADHRVACTGKSYGGYLSAWAIGHTGIFKAAVVAAPVSNIESHAGTSDTGYYVTPYAMDGEITDERTRCHVLSPVEYCADVEAATLILQGADDRRCPLGQSEELFANLIRCSRAPVRMVVYPGATHGLSAAGKPSHRLDYHARLVDWVRRWAGNAAG